MVVGSVFQLVSGCCWSGSGLNRFLFHYYTIERVLAIATMKTSQQLGKMQDVWMAPDELELLLESIHAYAHSNDGKRRSGRLAFLREKLVQVKLNGSALRVYPSR